MSEILHVTSQAAWDRAAIDGELVHDSLASEGFIHCCSSEQLRGVVDRYFPDTSNLIVVRMDTARLRPRLIFEKPPGSSEQFPHVYGPINVDSVLDVRSLQEVLAGSLKILRAHHVAVICSDYAKSRRFYTEILGLEIVSEIHRAGRDSYKLDLRMEDGTQIELFSFPNPPKRPSYPEACGLRHLAFEVADIDEAVRALRSFSVEVEDIRLDEQTLKRFTFFADPDGLPLELYEKSAVV